MRTLFFFLAFCPFLPAADIHFLDAGMTAVGDRTRYWFAFDEAPLVYYPRQAGKQFFLDIYGARPSEGALLKLSGLGKELSGISDTAPLPLISLVFSLSRGQRAEAFPVGDLLFVETGPSEEERLWKLPHSAALPVALYQLDGAEELVFTLPDTSARCLFRDSGTRFSVEIFALGLFFPDTGYALPSKFLSKFRQTTLPVAPLSPEAVGLFDFALKKKTTVTPQYLPHNLVIRMEKP